MPTFDTSHLLLDEVNLLNARIDGPGATVDVNFLFTLAANESYSTSSMEYDLGLTQHPGVPPGFEFTTLQCNGMSANDVFLDAIMWPAAGVNLGFVNAAAVTSPTVIVTVTYTVV